MISFLLYVSAMSALLVAAAMASEPVLRALRAPTRVAWIVALVGTVFAAGVALRDAPVAPTALPAVESRISAGAPPSGPFASAMGEHGAAPVPEARAYTVAAPEAARHVPRLAFALAACWALGTLVCLLRLLIGASRLARVRRSCRRGRLAGEPVLVSPTTGPAVVGVFRYEIVVPAWIEALGDDAQRLILAHEREHIRARDPLLLHAATLLVALMPWNVPLWIAWLRLRAAIEIDCDARVLRHQRPAARRYCRLLLDVGERRFAAVPPLLALAEPATLLERRIEAMTTTRRVRDWKTLLPAAGAALLLAGACRAPRPAVGLGPRLSGLVSELSSALAPTRSDVAQGPARAPMPAPSPAAATSTPMLQWSAPTSVAPTGVMPPPSAEAQRTPPATTASPDTTIRNEEAMRRSAMDHQARVDAIADSVIRNVYPELMSRPASSTAFLALVLDDRERLMRHRVSVDRSLPNDLGEIMLALAIDTISARTIGLGITANNPWHVTVGHAVERLGPPYGKSEMRAWMASPLPQILRRVPYEHIVDSVARARSPGAFETHQGTYAIAILLEEDGRVAKYAEEPAADSAMWKTNGAESLKRMLAYEAPAGAISGYQARLQPSRALIYWTVRK